MWTLWIYYVFTLKQNFFEKTPILLYSTENNSFVQFILHPLLVKLILVSFWVKEVDKQESSFDVSIFHLSVFYRKQMFL